MNKRCGLGFTLTELMIVVAIIGVLASMAAPSFQRQIQVQRVKGATEALFGALQNAKAEAIKTNSDIRIVFTPSDVNAEHVTWCYGMTSAGDDTCVCTVDADTTNDCATGSVVQGSEYTDIRVEFNTANKRKFSPLRGTATSGTVTLAAGPASDNKTLGVTTSSIGRIRVCKVANSTISTNSGDCP